MISFQVSHVWKVEVWIPCKCVLSEKWVCSIYMHFWHVLSIKIKFGNLTPPNFTKITFNLSTTQKHVNFGKREHFIFHPQWDRLMYPDRKTTLKVYAPLTFLTRTNTILNETSVRGSCDQWHLYAVLNPESTIFLNKFSNYNLR